MTKRKLKYFLIACLFVGAVATITCGIVVACGEGGTQSDVTQKNINNKQHGFDVT